MSTAHVFIDDVNTRSAATHLTGDQVSLYVDEDVLRTFLRKVTGWNAETIVRSSALYADDIDETPCDVTLLPLLQDRTIDLRPGLVGAIVETACKSPPPVNIILITGDSHLKSTVTRCLRLGARVHVVGIIGRISPRLYTIAHNHFKSTATDPSNLGLCLDLSTKESTLETGVVSFKHLADQTTQTTAVQKAVSCAKLTKKMADKQCEVAAEPVVETQMNGRSDGPVEIEVDKQDNVSTAINHLPEKQDNKDETPSNSQVEGRKSAKERLVCKWFMYDNIIGKATPASGKWPEGCYAHIIGQCPYAHPDQKEWGDAVDAHRVRVRTEPCSKGYFCKNPRKCFYAHSPNHVKYFDLHRIPPIKRKYTKCPHGSANCAFAQKPQKCSFLHPGETRLCLWCNKRHSPDCFESSKTLNKL